MSLSTEDEFNLRLVPSVLHQGKRVRAVRNKVFFRPPTETFHEFLRLVLQLTFGDAWWHEQQSLRMEKQHVVIKWSKAVSAWLAGNQIDENRVGDKLWAVQMSGHAQSLLQLGFDLFCLQQADRLPDSLVERLRNYRGFQGARYEVAVASIFARAGFRIRFCEEEKGNQICEFIATLPSGTSVAVEAKSRHRPGVLNEKGVPPDEYRADFKKLYGNARKKKPDLPFVIFIDANLPPEPDVPWAKSPWLQDIKGIFEEFPEPTPDRPDPHNMVVITNYGSFFYGNDPAKLQPALYIVSAFSTWPLPNERVLNAIQGAVERYATIPREV
jgi:hypothetical protein